MRVQNEQERETAAQTLKEVMQKLEEAMRLAREQERPCEGSCDRPRVLHG